MLTSRATHLCLVALLGYTGGLGVWAIASDNRPTATDSIFVDAANMREMLDAGVDGAGWSRWLRSTGYRPPLSYLPHVALSHVAGESVAGLRLTTLAMYLLAVWLCHAIGARVAGREAGLLGATMAATLPMVFGWGRMDYADTSVALALLATVRLLLDAELARPRHALGLGVVVGLGMLTKVAFPIFLLGPLVWALALRLRTRRQLLGFGVAVASAALVATWWYIPQLEIVLINASMSRSQIARGGSWLETLYLYTVATPGGLWVLCLALAGSIAAWRGRLLDRSWLALLSLATWMPLALLVALFDGWRRYALPVYPVAAVLAGVCLYATLTRLHRRLGRLAAAALAVLLLADFTSITLGRELAVPPGPWYLAAGERADGLGLLSPDRRDYGAFPAALDALWARDRHGLLVASSARVLEHHGYWLAEQYRLRRGAAPLAMSTDELPDGWRLRPLHVLLLSDPDAGQHWRAGVAIHERAIQRRCLAYQRFARARGRLLLGRWGPSPLDDTRYMLYRLPPGALGPRLDASPDCRLRPVAWDALVHRPPQVGSPAPPAPGR